MSRLALDGVFAVLYAVANRVVKRNRKDIPTLKEGEVGAGRYEEAGNLDRSCGLQDREKDRSRSRSTASTATASSLPESYYDLSTSGNLAGTVTDVTYTDVARSIQVLPLQRVSSALPMLQRPASALTTRWMHGRAMIPVPLPMIWRTTA